MSRRLCPRSDLGAPWALLALGAASCLCWFALACASTGRTPEAPAAGAREAREALAVVARRIAALNAHDWPGFLAAYAEDVRLYDYPARELGSGHVHLERIFAKRFERGDVQVEGVHRQAIGRRVITREILRTSERIETYVAIYSVRDGLIREVRFIVDDD